jgi:hypothetical protein
MIPFPLQLTSSRIFHSEDILNVRLQTLGVIEHSFDINLGGISYNWKMYDVGGAVRVRKHCHLSTSDLLPFLSSEGSGKSSFSHPHTSS